VLLQLLQHGRDAALHVDAHARRPEAIVHPDRADGNGVELDVGRMTDVDHTDSPGIAAGLRAGARQSQDYPEKTPIRTNPSGQPLYPRSKYISTFKADAALVYV